jgi:hypothetical protein
MGLNGALVKDVVGGMLLDLQGSLMLERMDWKVATVKRRVCRFMHLQLGAKTNANIHGPHRAVN